MTVSIATSKSALRSRSKRPPLMKMLNVWSERRALARMDIARLQDMGISPQDAAKESARPFWDLPACRNN